MIRQALRRVTSPTTHVDDISWRVGIFALERLRSDSDSWLSPNVLWADYFCWCGAKDVQPLPAANFLQKFDEVAVSLGARKFRAGDTVGYARIAFRPAS